MKNTNHQKKYMWQHSMDKLEGQSAQFELKQLLFLV